MKRSVPEDLQMWSVLLLRILIGWHFLYEGIAKAMNPNWSSLPYLMDSKGLFAEMFYAIGANPALLKFIDFLNIYGLMAIGLGLILGLFTCVAAYSGILLLLFYYLSHPALIAVKYAVPSEGSYLFVNKNLIEMAALWVIVMFPTGRVIGIDRILIKLCCKNKCC
jgi:thiosulfate dehydrogenase (quinone) large subunit